MMQWPPLATDLLLFGWLGKHTQIKMQQLECTHGIDSLLPRVMNKLTVCVYPMSVIRPEVTDITGLDNYN